MVANARDPYWGGFVAGLHESHTVTETAGSEAKVELHRAPLGACRLLNQPLAALVNRFVPLTALFGAWVVKLAEQVQVAFTRGARFAMLDAALIT